MRVDHVSYAAEPDGLQATTERLAAELRVTAVEGGIHPRFGTRNMILPLAHERVDLVIPVEHRDTPPVQALLDTLTSPAFRAEIAALPGYDVSRTGQVVLEELVGV